MQVELHKSYFTLQCDLEVDGRAWAYLNEFICIGKNRNDYYVCLTASIPIELEVTEGGGKLTILHDKELFSGRRPTAQSILQFTLKHWSKLPFIEFNRSITGCLLLSNMGRKELRNDANQLLDVIKKALPEVRALWHIQTLDDKIKSSKREDIIEKEKIWIDKFPSDWLIIFGGIISVSSGSLETKLYTRQKAEFDLSLTGLLPKFSEKQTISLNLSDLDDNYVKKLGLKVELDLDFSKSKLIFRIIFNYQNTQKSKEVELIMCSDHVSVSDPEKIQFTKIDRIVLNPSSGTIDLPYINLMVNSDEISDNLAEIFDREAEISVRLDRFLSRR